MTMVTEKRDITPQRSLVRRVSTAVTPALDAEASGPQKAKGFATIVGLVAGTGVAAAAGFEGVNQLAFQNPHAIISAAQYMGEPMAWTAGTAAVLGVVASLMCGVENPDSEDRREIHAAFRRVAAGSFIATAGIAAAGAAAYVGGDLGGAGLTTAGHAAMETAAAFGSAGLALSGIGRLWRIGQPKHAPPSAALGE